MAIPLEALESQVLKLPTADRTRLLDRVVASLDADAVRDAAWDAVAAARQAEAERDPSVMLPLDEVLDRIRAELQ
jgi:Putative addiction module component